VGRDGDGADDWWCLVDAGPHGGDSTGHAHTDLGHVEIAHGATHIVTDPGCAAYTTDLAARDRCRSETSHACLVIDGAPLAEPAGPFSWARVSPLPTQHGGDTDEVWWCELTYDRPSPNGTVRHHRQVVLVRGRGVVVCDWLDGAVSPFAVHWPLADRASDLCLSGDTLAAPAYALSWSVTGGSATATLDAATRSPAYGRVQPSAMLRVMIDARGRAASSVTCFAESRDALQVAAHDGETVRITYTTRGDVPATLTITRGGSPTSAGISQGVAS
jgi:hypothetical protein